MTVFVDKTNDRWWGECFTVSTEFSDPLLYPKARSEAEAVKLYEQDTKIKATKVFARVNGKYEEV